MPSRIWKLSVTLNPSVETPSTVGALCGIVTQICNLLYRRIGFSSESTTTNTLELFHALPIANRRYDRLQICATPNAHATPRRCHVLPSRDSSGAPTALTLLLVVFCWLCSAFDSRAASKKVMVLGIDGMDPKLLQTFVDQGRMPNFKALM